jgi:hypothetical protein
MRAALFIAFPALLASIPAQAMAPASPEARLARTLEGRVAGERVDCIDLRQVRSTEVINDTAILYKMTDGTVYLNRPEAGRTSLNQWDVLLTRTQTSRLCSIDVVDMYDPVLGVQKGPVFLGEFVPYRRAGSRAGR